MTKANAGRASYATPSNWPDTSIQAPKPSPGSSSIWPIIWLSPIAPTPSLLQRRFHHEVAEPVTFQRSMPSSTAFNPEKKYEFAVPVEETVPIAFEVRPRPGVLGGFEQNLTHIRRAG